MNRKHLFEIEISFDIINTITFDQFNASLLMTVIISLKKKRLSTNF